MTTINALGLDASMTMLLSDNLDLSINIEGRPIAIDCVGES